MPATGRDVVVLPPKKGGTAGLLRNINYETGEVHMPWK
jgi:2-phospho-L-lactate guanylyltransferase (CobY/MobA/RfbA family)